jgi:hypothetical protein
MLCNTVKVKIVTKGLAFKTEICCRMLIVATTAKNCGGVGEDLIS